MTPRGGGIGTRDEVSFDVLAALVERLAVLTVAGIPALAAWRYAAATAPAQIGSVPDELESAHDLPARLDEIARGVQESQRSAWGALAATWRVATESGTSLAATLGRLADVLRDLGQGAREIEVALAGPTATSCIVLALPVVGLLLGVVLGFDVVGALVSVPGAVCVAGGGILIGVAVRWNRRLVRRARDLDAAPGLAFDLLAVALAGGTSIDRARDIVTAACADAGLGSPDDAVDDVLAFAQEAGVPVVTLLRAEADERRRAARATAARQAAELESALLLPLGLCVLPAFVLIGVMPIALAVVSSTALDTAGF